MHPDASCTPAHAHVHVHVPAHAHAHAHAHTAHTCMFSSPPTHVHSPPSPTSRAQWHYLRILSVCRLVHRMCAFYMRMCVHVHVHVYVRGTCALRMASHRHMHVSNAYDMCMTCVHVHTCVKCMCHEHAHVHVRTVHSHETRVAVVSVHLRVCRRDLRFSVHLTHSTHRGQREHHMRIAHNTHTHTHTHTTEDSNNITQGHTYYTTTRHAHIVQYRTASHAHVIGADDVT